MISILTFTCRGGGAVGLERLLRMPGVGSSNRVVDVPLLNARQ